MQIYEETTHVQPLCPELYRILRGRFGTVTIANEGAPFVGQLVADGHRGQSLDIVDPGEYYRVNCPFCHDTRRRLWVNHRYGADGLGFRALAVCYNDTQCLTGQSARAVANRTQLEQMLLGSMSREQRSQLLAVRQADVEYQPPVVEWPGAVYPLAELPPRHPANQYLSERRFNPVQLSSAYGLCYCDRAMPAYGIAEGRIIIPFLAEGAMVGWQARYIGEADWKRERIQKYYNMRGFHRARYLYNFDRARRGRLIVVVEGITNTWRLGAASVATLGNNITARQQELLGSWATAHPGRPLALVLAYDNDPLPAGIEERARRKEADDRRRVLISRLDQMLMKSGGGAIEVQLPVGVDIADLDRNAAWRMIYSAIQGRGLAPEVFLDGSHDV